jgi:hypothetical protein
MPHPRSPSPGVEERNAEVAEDLEGAEKRMTRVFESVDFVSASRAGRGTAINAWLSGTEFDVGSSAFSAPLRFNWVGWG